ncbi:type I secretion membrane fusion protein, HlyD family [Dictyocaulus viviparus]|uniref:Type I secretion membrane fusion protein, HlyD family n=1 Tax=Dictyocaulus viviparus TaxID=29172 RepID=A0A0D8X8E4_DICVI|nr:type I secretion membrane fusion protein, HlyD family [Dictyocaulus viviparus]
MMNKTFTLIDVVVSFILKRERNNVNEVLRVTWGPLFFGLIVIFTFFGIGGIWSVIAPIDGAVHTSGEVIVSSNRKIVQHLGGGIISKILVKDGQAVKKDEPLVLSSDINVKANLSIIKEKLLLLLATEARLIAIRGGLDTIEFPDEVKELFDGNLAKKKQFAEIEGRVGHYRATISQVRQRIGENESEIINVKSGAQERANIEPKEVGISIADLRERLMVAEDALARTVIRSPQNGIVTNIRYHTEGGVIQSGMPIMSIVPSNDDLIVDAKVQTRNIEEILSAQKKDSNMVSIDGLEGLKVKHKSLLGKTDILQQRIRQFHDKLVGLNSQLDAVLKQYDLIAEELETKRQLLSGGHIGKPHILALEKQFAEIEGRVGHYRATISQVRQRIGENELEIINVKSDAQERANIEPKEVGISIADLRERLMVAEDALARTVIRSPQNGIVTNIRYHTEGGVIQSGMPIMSIVPSNDDLIVDAKVQTRNIEEILSAQKKDSNMVSIDGLEGLKVKVRLIAYSARRLSLINGIVSYISPDTLDDPRLGRYYSVRVVIPKSELAQFKNVYLYPGMPVEVYIVTQSRTLLSFLFAPIIATVDRSFIESKDVFETWFEQFLTQILKPGQTVILNNAAFCKLNKVDDFVEKLFSSSRRVYVPLVIPDYCEKGYKS